MGKQWKQKDFLLRGSKTTADGDCSSEIQRCFLLGRKARQCIKKQRHYFANKGLSSQSYGFSSGHVWIWEFDHKESRALENWWFWTVVLEKTIESPLDCKEIQPVNPKGDQSWVFIWGTDAEAEAPILWPPDAESPLIRKDPEAGKHWRQEKGLTSPTQWTWVWASSGRWWRTGRPGVLHYMGFQRVRHYSVTEQQRNQTDTK